MEVRTVTTIELNYDEVYTRYRLECVKDFGRDRMSEEEIEVISADIQEELYLNHLEVKHAYLYTRLASVDFHSGIKCSLVIVLE